MDNDKFKQFIRWVLSLVAIAGIVTGVAYWLRQRSSGVLQVAHVEFNVPQERIRKVLLDNGMTILLYQDKSTPRVVVQIAYDIGSAIEESGERGLAHLIEHMIFKGTKKLSETDIDAISRKFGAVSNAFTAQDATSYFFESDRANWRYFIDILADCMQNSRFDEQHLASEVRTVVQELNMYKDKHTSIMLEKALETLFPASHPYHYPIVGYKEELARLNASRLQQFYSKYYHPNHAVLFIAGDIDLKEAEVVAREQFSQIPAYTGPEPERKFHEIVDDLSVQSTRMYEDVQKEWLGFFWRVPGHKVGKDSVATIVCELLGGGEGSRLYRRLVDEAQVADDLAMLVDDLMEAGIFALYVAPKEGKRDECKRLVVEELNKAISDGISDEEIARVTSGKVTEFFHNLESPHDLVCEWIFSYFATRDEYALFRRPSEYYAVDSGMVQEYLSAYLDPFFASTIEMLPLPKDRRRLWENAKRRGEEIEAEILNKHQRRVPIEEPSFANSLPEPASFQFDFPEPTKTFVLKNGLKVIFYQDDKLPIVTAHCYLRDAEYFGRAKQGHAVGCAMDMLIEGSEGFSKEENVDFLNMLGADYSFDAGGAKISVLSSNFMPALTRFFHVLLKPAFAKEPLEKVKEQLIGLLQRSQDSAPQIAQRVLANEVYRGSDFAWTFDEAINQIEALHLEDVVELHAHHVQPTHMVLSIAGSFDAEAVKTFLERSLSSWHGDTYYPVTPGVRQVIPGKKIDVRMLRDQAVLMFGRASDVTVYSRERIPLALLSTIAFHSLGSRLYKVRERSGLFYLATGSFAAQTGREPGYDYLYAILSPDKINESETILMQTLKKLSQDGVSPAELGESRQIFLRSCVDLSSTRSAVATTLAALDAKDLGFDYYKKAWDRVQKLPLAEINDLARKYASTDNLTRIRVGRI